MTKRTMNRKPTVAEEREQLARDGNYRKLWALWTESDLSDINFAEVGKLVERAVKNRARQDPLQLALDIFGDMMGLTSLLVLRGHHRMQQLFRREDRCMADRGRWDESDELKAAVPALLELQGHAAELAATYATMQRSIELTRRMRLQNDKAERSTRRRRPRRRGAAQPAGNHSNGMLPRNRLAGLFTELTEGGSD